MLTVKKVLDRILSVIEGKGYNATVYSNHLIIYNDEFKTDITVIDDNLIIIHSRGSPRDRISIVKVFDIMRKSDEELLHVLGL